MADYLWYGENAQLRSCQGVARGQSIAQLRAELTIQGVRLQNCYRLRHWHRRRRLINATAAADLFLQWQRLLAAGLPLLECISLAVPRQMTMPLRWQLWLLQEYLRQGYTLSQICEQQGLLPAYQVAMLAAGENQSALGQALAALAQQQLQTMQLLKQLKRNLLMPAITLVAGALVCVLILLFLVPNIASLVAHSEAPIPTATQWLLFASAWLHEHGQLLLLGLLLGVLVIVLGLKSHRASAVGALLLTCLPGWKGIYQLQSQLLVMQLLAASLTSGIALLEALQLSQRAVPHAKLASRLHIICQCLQSGMGVSRAFTKAGFAEDQVVMLRLAEQSGDLAGACQHLSKQSQRQLEDKMAMLSSLLEPLITSLLALLVGSLVVAIYLPLMQMGSLM